MLHIRYLCRIFSRISKYVYGLLVLIVFYFLLEGIKREQKIILWWTPFVPEHDRLVECSSGYKCLISSRRKYINDHRLGGILFYGSKIVNHDFPIPRNTQVPWAIFHEESPKNYAPFLNKDTQDLFNITSTFSQHSDFPVTLQYLKSINDLTDKKYFISVKAKNQFLEKISPVLYIQSDCDTPIGRDYLVKEMSKYVQIDSYGSCLKNKNFPFGISNLYPLDLYNEEFMKFISKYKFIISFENAVCEDYVTEKFWRPLIVGSIPIYLGASNIEQWVPNENSAILVKNFKDIQTLSEFINQVNENDTMYNGFMEHKISSKMENKLLQKHILSDHPIPEFECYICKKIHENQDNFKIKNKNVYECPKPVPIKDEKNTWDQHWDIGKCQSDALQLYIKLNKEYSEEMFEATWKNFCYKPF